MAKCSMKHIQTIYNDINRTKYEAFKEVEKKKADEIFNAYHNQLSTTDKPVIIVLKKGFNGSHVRQSMLVQHFPYTSTISRWFEVEKNKDNSKTVTLYPRPFIALERRQARLEKKILEIVKELGIDQTTDEYEAAKKLALYIANHCTYDYEDESGYEAYHCLVKGLTVCCGYSEGFKALCDYCGIKCQCIGSDDHQWNRVKIDGKWLNVDVCWIATGSSKDAYLLTDDERFFRAHDKGKVMKSYWEYN